MTETEIADIRLTCKIVKLFLSHVEAIVRQRFRENMKYSPYTRACEYYPEAFQEVLSEMERACGSANTGLENTEECLPGLQGGA